MRAIAIAIATALGVGYAPAAPGTCGTILAVPLFVWLSPMPPWLYLVTVAGVVAMGTWAAGVAGQAFGEVDHKRIVIDEVAGYLVTMALTRPTVNAVIAGFVLFRTFDILKPWPVGWVDRKVKNAAGVMLDDILAGLYGLAVLSALKVFLPSFFL